MIEVANLLVKIQTTDPARSNAAGFFLTGIQLLTFNIKYVSVLQRAKKAQIIVTMKKFIPGVIFLFTFGALVALLVTKKTNLNNINPVAVAHTTPTLTVSNTNPSFPTDEK